MNIDTAMNAMQEKWTLIFSVPTAHNLLCSLPLQSTNICLKQGQCIDYELKEVLVTTSEPKNDDILGGD